VNSELGMPVDRNRLHGLDAVRGFALLLGVALHATMSYLPGSQYWWIVGDTDPSLALSGLFYWVHMFRMPLFFLIAGFFAHLSFHRLGMKAFIKDRFKRIVVPLVSAWPMVFTGIILVIIWIALIKFNGSLPKESPPGPKFTSDDFPLTHLWFLYVLSLLYVAILTMRTAMAKFDRLGRIRACLDALVRQVRAQSKRASPEPRSERPTVRTGGRHWLPRNLRTTGSGCRSAASATRRR